MAEPYPKQNKTEQANSEMRSEFLTRHYYTLCVIMRFGHVVHCLRNPRRLP